MDEIVDGDFVDEISNFDRNSPFCFRSEITRGLSGVYCSVDVLTKVVYMHLRRGNFQVHYMPNSVRSIEIAFSHQDYELQTRHLPRDLQILNLHNNRIQGTVDFTALPARMGRVELHNNSILGKINLTQLPETVTLITLYGNAIVQETVYYGALHVIARIQLSRPRSGNRFTKVAPMIRAFQHLNKAQVFSFSACD